MGGLLFIGLLALLAIESVRAWKVRSRYCGICGRQMGLWHIEASHKKHSLSPGVSIVVILGVMAALAAVIAFVLR